MRRLFWILSLTLLATLFVGCSDSGADLIIHNTTSNRLWVTLGSEEFLLYSGEQLSQHFETEEQTIFNNDITRDVKVGLMGETYRIFDYNGETFVDETTVKLRVEETSHVYCNSNLACIKVINLSDTEVTKVKYTKRYESGNNPHDTFLMSPPLEYEEEWFLPVDGIYESHFYYELEVTLDNDVVVTAGDSLSSSLYIDEIFTVIINEENSGE